MPDTTRCSQTKESRFSKLRCTLPAQHDGHCNFVVYGVRPEYAKPGRPRKQSDADYKNSRDRNARYLSKKEAQ